MARRHPVPPSTNLDEDSIPQQEVVARLIAEHKGYPANYRGAHSWYHVPTEDKMALHDLARKIIKALRLGYKND